MTEKRAISVKFPKYDPAIENPYQEEMDKIIDDNMAQANTTRTLKNITENLSKALKSKYGISDKEELKRKTQEILKLHGLSPENFDPVNFISKQVFGNLTTINDISVDDNANKTDTNMTGVCVESMLAYQKLAGYDYLYQTIKELYGKTEAKKCTADMYDFSLALNDSTKILLPYCYCIDASKIVKEGRNFGQVHSSPARRISTYISVLGDTIREMSFNLAGAIAVGTFFLDIAHLAIYRERITLEDLKNDRKTRKKFTNHFQQFIHTVNHYSRNAVESPFTNISCFDRDKLRTLIDEDNYDWYFPKKAAVVEDNNLEDTKEAYKEFVLDYIEELQELYIDEFDKGDPLRGGLQFPFPVTTVNLGIKIEDDGSRHLMTENNTLLNYIVKKDISRYNIYCSEGTKVASCCVKANQDILVKVNGNGTVMTVASLYNRFINEKESTFELKGIDGFYPIKNAFQIVNKTGRMLKITLETGETVSLTADHPSVKVDPETNKLIEVRTDKLEVGDLIPCGNSKVLPECGYTNIAITSIEEEDIGEGTFVYDFEVDSKEHLFQLANGIITHNCRLISDTEFMAYAGGVNSFGGSQVSLGSHRVVTLNFARCAYEAESYDDFKEIVSDRIERMGKILKAHKVLILKLEKLGKQPWISNGWIDMTHMFSTFGVLGYLEADEILKQKFNHVDFDYMKDFLVYFNAECKRVADEENIIFNIEAIPGEGMSPKLAKSDEILVGGTYKIYANQWCSLWKNHTLVEKMKRDGQINALITGGSIVHSSVDSKLTSTQARNLIRRAIEYGMEHFAINCVYTECTECHSVEKGDFDKCPHCSSEKIDKFSRVIGYFSKVSAWNKTRREEDFPNRKFYSASDLESQLG